MVVCCACMLAFSLLSSLLSPTTSNVVKRPFQLSDLHSEAPGSSNACTRIFGKRTGVRLDAWMAKNSKWLLTATAGSTIILAIWRSVPTLLVYDTFVLALSIPIALCLDVRVVQKLLRVAGVWYFVLAVAGGQVSFALIYGQTLVAGGWWMAQLMI